MAWFKRKADPPPPGPAPEAGDPSAPEARRGVFARLKQRLSKTRRNFADGVGRILTGKRKIDAEVLDQIEELLITADVGVQTATELIERISSAQAADADELQRVLR
nr:signal recognition particle receptor subunit alpha [Desulfobacterales bacterium]